MTNPACWSTGGQEESPHSESAPLVELLDRIEVPNVDVSVYPVRDHRFVLVLSGEGLDEQVTETDPQALGVPPMEAKAAVAEAEKTVRRSPFLHAAGTRNPWRKVFGKHGSFARLFGAAGLAGHGKDVPSQPGRHSCVPDVPRLSPSCRDEGHSDGHGL